ncbi:MAG: polysaccharide biosynthesis C-terminal domain-containing protein [Flavobacteriaceae bacterium]|nr:polysaccharide biosynthesis C-terminal domain-containing protein [Flavobacteriaceae bacterium]
MGIVLKQSFINTIILFLGFAIGGMNVLFLYTHFLHEDYYGLITFLLSSANIILPLLVFGMQHTIIKFFSAYKAKEQRDIFLTTSLFLPLLIIIPLGLIGALFYDTIATWLSTENAIIKSYTYLIFLAAIFMGYFEVFYSWSKVQLQSVFGNFIKEMFARISVTILLILVYLGKMTNEQFIYAVVTVYGIRMLIMMIYAFTIYKPIVIFRLPENLKEILSYSFYIILAGSAAGILLEIDKFMIPQLEQIAQVAYYSVGIYIASVISIPSRAMKQIINPLTAKGLNTNNLEEVESLYKKSSVNLLAAGGLLFLLINLNVKDLYILIDKPEFSVGVLIVLLISVSEMIKTAIGTNGAILTNSKYYKAFFYFSIAMALSVIVLNRWLIGILGIDGAALATLLVVFLYSLVKVFYVNQKLKMQPFTGNTLKVLFLIAMVFLAFYFWNFSFHPILNILLKTVLISVIYLFLIIRLKVSDDIQDVLKHYKLPI